MDQKVILGIAVVVIIAVGGYYLMQKPETPPIEYTLSVDSSPISGVTVTVDGVEHESPFTTELEEGSYTMVVPDELTVEGIDYWFTGWADGGANPQKTVTLTADTNLEAQYDEIETSEPDPEPTTQVTISGVVTDSESGDPIVGASVSIDGETATTGTDGSYEVTVDKGTYTMSVSYNGYEDETSSVPETDEETLILDLALNAIPSQPTGVTLNVLTRHGSDITRTAELLFRETEYWEEYNFVDIKWVPVTASLWIDTIDRKGDIDMAWGGGPVWFDILYREGLTSPLVSDEVSVYLNQIPDMISGAPSKRIDDGEVHWVGAAISSFGFTINTNTLELEGLPQPTKWIDLANETYSVVLPFPIIGTADPTRSTSNTRMFEIILQTYGWEEGWKLLTLLGGNSIIYEGSELVRDAAIRGDIGAGTTIDFYGYTAQLENPELCEYIFPEDGTIVNADPIAMINTSPNPEAAQAFIAWILSPEGQEPWLDPTVNRLPINTQVFETERGQERPDLEENYYKSIDALKIEFSDDIASSYEFTMMNFFKYTLVTPETQLKDAWYELGRAKLDGDLTSAEFKTLVDELTNPLLFEFTDPDTGETVTFSEEYAISINQKLMTDPEFKQAIVDLWTETAIARYSSVEDQVLSISP
jgi:ABC-type Fe3+ transport system substrate-binding protein